MVIAHIFGGVRLVLEMVFTAPLCGEEETRPPFLYKLHYLYFAQIELVFTVIVVIVISLFTKQRSEDEVCYKYAGIGYIRNDNRCGILQNIAFFDFVKYILFLLFLSIQRL